MLRLHSLCVCLLVTFSTTSFSFAKNPNVLFIAVDDLRPELGCYGAEHIHSPNIDRLAQSGFVMDRAFCMVPTCGASRASMMTSIRPKRDRFINHLAWAEKDAPGITTMNTHFRRSGYTTLSLGKVFHHPTDNAEGWSQPAWRPGNVPTYQNPENAKIQRQRQKLNSKNRGPAWESADVADDVYADGQIAARAITELKQLKESEKPFFLAVGFLKPHLPFVAPKKYWELYDHDSIQVPENYAPPQDAPKESIHNSGELRAYAGIPQEGLVGDENARNLIHGYYACVSYTDAQIGKVLKALDTLELTDNTIVVLWGDHGWNLGEHTLWCKHSCYETSMHIPLIIRAPGFASGQHRDQLVESIDLYPTFCELSGLPIPNHVQGESLVPILRDELSPSKPAAVGRFTNGDTIRTDAFRYSEYSKSNGEVTSSMMYDHRSDPNENVNISQKEEPTASKLSQQLKGIIDRHP